MTNHQLSKISPTEIAKANSENEIVKASKSALFSSFKPSDKATTLRNFILTAFFDTGYTIAGETDKDRLDHINAIIARLLVLIPEQFPFITGEEIRLACRNGATGVYGDVHGISPRTVLSWLTEYQSRKGKIILEATPPALPAPVKEPSPAEWQDMMIAKLRTCYKQVQAGQKPTDWGNVLFKFLRDRKMIVLEQSDIDDYMERGKAQVIADNDPNDATSLGDRIDRRNLIKALFTGQTQQQLVVIRARNIALHEYLMLIDDIDSEIEKIQSVTK